MTNGFSVTLVNDDKVKKQLQELSRRAKRPEEAMKLVANAMRRDVLQHFDAERGENGSWKDLKPATWKWKQAHGYTRKLQNTGQLRRNNTLISGNDWAGVENTLSYARTQNYGSNKVPAREFFWLSKQAMQHIVGLVKNYILGGL